MAGTQDVEGAGGGHLSALRSALSLDGELTEQQRETYFALLEPHEDTN